MANILHRLSHFLHRREPALFAGWLLFHLLPIWVPAWFYTYDGPAHFHNSWLIEQLLRAPNSYLSQWYVFNENPDPNWLFYLLTTPLQWLLGPMVAEKAFATLYLFAFAYGFRHFIGRVGHTWQGWAAWPVFYFVFHSNFFLGQYNFALSMACLWWVLDCWERLLVKATWTNWMTLLFLLWLTYLAHLVGFLSAGLILGVRLFVGNELSRQARRQYLARLALISLVPLGLSIRFLFQKGSNNSMSWLSTEELWERLYKLTAFVVFNPDSEFKALFPILILILVGLGFFIYRLLKGDRRNFIWWLVAAILLFLYFVMPDATSGASYLSSRFALLSTMFLVVGALSSWQGWGLKSLVLLLLVAGQTHLLLYYTHAETGLGNDMEEFQEGMSFLKPESVVQQLNYSPNWMHEHLTEAIFEKQIVHLNNYEAFNAYFPLKWNLKKTTAYHHTLKSFGSWPPCLDRHAIAMIDEQPKPDYFLRWYYNWHVKASCDSTLVAFLDKNYTLSFVSSGKKLEIFTLKAPHAP